MPRPTHVLQPCHEQSGTAVSDTIDPFSKMDNVGLTHFCNAWATGNTVSVCSPCKSSSLTWSIIKPEAVIYANEIIDKNSEFLITDF